MDLFCVFFLYYSFINFIWIYFVFFFKYILNIKKNQYPRPGQCPRAARIVDGRRCLLPVGGGAAAGGGRVGGGGVYSYV